MIKPLVKWAGGKCKLADHIISRFPKSYKTYCEPFAGSCAVALRLNPDEFILNDANDELINFYQQVKKDPDAVVNLAQMFFQDEKTYYEIRNWDKDIYYKFTRTKLARAARFIYMNKLCFNGLWRVNDSTGCFNVPFGKKDKQIVFNRANFHAVSQFLNRATIVDCDFEQLENLLRVDDLVYIDPPYAPLSVTSSFTKYTKGGFTLNDHVRLKEFCDRLTAKGVQWVLSNSSIDFVHNLYSSYNIEVVDVKRLISAKSSSRKVIQEVLIRNY